ncbi:MAG: hypothetical protein ABR514_00055, partial [Chthoniobacterales bacterium]
MDRTAWIAIGLSVIGLVLWEIYISKQMQQARPASAPAGATATPFSPTPGPAVSPTASPSPSATPAATVAPFEEKIETLRNADVELRLTNRGGGIAEAVLLNHKAEQDRRVILNSPDHAPIGAIIDDPAAPALPEYKLTRQGEVVQFEYTTPERVVVRKKFFFQKPEPRDNFIAELDVDLENGGTEPYAKPAYFVALGSAVPLHPKDYPSFTRLAWC